MITIPTISQLTTAIIADMETAYGGSLPTFGKNMLRVLALVQAGKLRLYYLAIGNLQKNIFADTADPEASGGSLERFGRVKLNRNPSPARAGQYSVQITGSVAAVVPVLTTFKSNDDSSNPGKLFILDTEYTLVATTGTIILRALEAGLDSKLFTGEGLTVTAPIPNVNKGALVVTETVEPLAAEDIEDYRAVTIEAYRLEPQGGAGSDYRLWSKDAQCVAQAYPYAKSGAANEINLFIEAVLADSTDGKGTPSGALLTAVEAVVEFDPDTTRPLEERGRRPLGVFQVHYLPVTIRDVDINIASFSGITAEIQTAIFNALKLALTTVRPFVASVDVLADRNDTFDVNKIISIILEANPGSSFGAVTLNIDGSPVSTYTFINGDIPFLDTVTYV